MLVGLQYLFGCLGVVALIGMNALALALVFKGSLLAILFLSFEAFSVVLGWKTIQALFHEATLPKTPPKDPSLPSFSEFHEQWKREHPEEGPR